jgi:hypothetical protein
LTGKNILLIAAIGFAFTVLSSIAVLLSGGEPENIWQASLSFTSWLSSLLVISGNKTISSYGIEYVVFGLIIGLILSNLNLSPAWMKEAARSEFFIKTGLIILGTSILFTDIVNAGLPGILQAVAVVIVVWFFALWLSRRLKVDDEFGVILASAVSICGVSAGHCCGGRDQGRQEKVVLCYDIGFARGDSHARSPAVVNKKIRNT